MISISYNWKQVSDIYGHSLLCVEIERILKFLIFIETINSQEFYK